MEAFVYCWTDHKNNMLYVGSHKGALDDGYVCSSKYMLEQYKIRPQDFTRQIIAEGLFTDIRKLESVILKSVNARTDESFYNRHENDGLFFEGWKTGEFSETHLKNMSIAASKRIRTKEHLNALHNGRRNSKNSPEHAAAVIASRLGSKHTLETKNKISKAKVGKPSTKNAASAAGKASAQKRKESGYYQTEEAKLRYIKMWETRRARKEGLVNGN